MDSQTYPEDSVLRRHAESARAYERHGMREHVPTDSVLRRHHAQLREAAAAGAGTPPPSKVGSRPAPSAAAPVQAPAGTPTPEPSRPDARRGGLFGWLSRLFGG